MDDNLEQKIAYHQISQSAAKSVPINLDARWHYPMPLNKSGKEILKPVVIVRLVHTQRKAMKLEPLGKTCDECILFCLEFWNKKYGVVHPIETELLDAKKWVLYVEGCGYAWGNAQAANCSVFLQTKHSIELIRAQPAPYSV